MIASRCGRRRRGAPDDRSLGCVLRPKGLATVRGAQRAPGPTYTRARGTKNEPTSGPAPRSTILRFIRRGSGSAQWATYTGKGGGQVSRAQDAASLLSTPASSPALFQPPPE